QPRSKLLQQFLTARVARKSWLRNSGVLHEPRGKPDLTQYKLFQNVSEQLHPIDTVVNLHKSNLAVVFQCGDVADDISCAIGQVDMRGVLKVPIPPIRQTPKLVPLHIHSDMQFRSAVLTHKEFSHDTAGEYKAKNIDEL